MRFVAIGLGIAAGSMIATGNSVAAGGLFMAAIGASFEAMRQNGWIP